MNQSTKKSILMLLLVMAFISCNQGPTLQTYFVDNELKPGFSSFDVPASFINVENITMTDDQLEAYDSVDKLNVLAYMLDSTNVSTFKDEIVKVNSILKDSSYQELARGGNVKDGKFLVKFLGDIENIDELIVFGSATNKGFVVVRVLGDDMNASKLMSLRTVLEDDKFEDSQLNGLTDFFK